MFISQVVVLILIGGSYLSVSTGEDHRTLAPKLPTIGISVLIRNKAHTLPYFLSCLYRQVYPKNRLYVRFYYDHSSDNSLEIVEDWLERFGSHYNGAYMIANKSSPALYEDETNTVQWSPMRFEHVIKLREDALEFARNQWADYVFMLDADVFLTEEGALKLLVEKRLPVVAPMLLSDGVYSNFWCEVSDQFYYKRCENYESIVEMDDEFIDCHAVPMVHSAVLVSLGLQLSDRLTYVPEKAEDYFGPVDDTVVFANNADYIGLKMHVCNTHLFGFVTRPPQSANSASYEQETLRNLKLQAISRRAPLPLLPFLEKYVTRPEPDTLGCSKIYMINLERREERRRLMLMNFRELDLAVEVVKAVDSRNLSRNYLRSLNVQLMPGYEDPYHKRPIKAGEIACFLSHYNIWQEIIKHGFSLTMILEDDVRFSSYFRVRVTALLSEVAGHDYDLIYLGRKVLLDGGERPVTAHTTKPLYSYWTLGYLLTLRGARKLLAADPLRRLLPVDEYIPIMFDQHPNEVWKSYFPVRDLKALSAAPLLIHPTHYTGMEGYVSDTEGSPIVDLELTPLRQDL